MPESTSFQSANAQPVVRRLKIEADGDFWKGLTKPKIRLTGRWLERAGFKPGEHVRVTCLAPGLIELRSLGAVIVNQAQPVSSDPCQRWP